MTRALSFVVVCITLSGCATTPEHGDLHRGPMVRTAPPRQKPATYAPTGTGLPEYWGTPDSRQHAEPGPKSSRVLPPTLEPGVWASKEPAATGVPTLLGVPFPLTDDDDPDSLKTNIACSLMMAEAVKRVSDATSIVATMDAQQRRCFVAQLHEDCAHELVAGNERSRAAGEYDATAFARIKEAEARAARFRISACSEVAMPPSASRLGGAVFPQFIEVLKPYSKGDVQ